MSRLHGETHRAPQDRFASRKLADRVEDEIVRIEITDGERKFIANRDMFFLALVDPLGRPT